MKKAALLLTLVSVLFLPADVDGQGTNATLSGTVTDPSGAAIHGVSVTALNTKTGVSQKTISNESGIYLFPSLQPGAYQITAELAGFRKLAYNDVKLEVSARISLNLPLELGPQNETIEVKAGLETSLGYVASSVGAMVTGQMVRDLPLPARNVLSLTSLQAGTLGDNFSGARIGALNISRDGVNVQDQRINDGVASTIFTSVDLIEEFRVVTSPADAELGRGSGQIQMITRSGNNEFHGSVFESHRNTLLNANTWFNNQRGRNPQTGEPISPRNFLIRNQFGGRLGGPILKNRTFFHVLFEGQRIRTKNSVTSTTYTETARKGIFRFFPGVQNANATAAVPTVDLSGNPMRPAQATGDLESLNLFGRDPNRLNPDASGVIQGMLGLMPLPNNFRTGDGLNTAGYTWIQSGSSDFNHLSARIDHMLAAKHRLNFNYTFEDGNAINSFMSQTFPKSPGGDNAQRDHFYSLAITSTLRPNLLNEFRYGALRPKVRFLAPWEIGGTGVLPTVGSQSYVVDFGLVSDPINQSNDPQGRISPSYQFSDNVSWMKGRHNFVGGAEARFVSTNGFNSFTVMPRANLGTGGVAIQNINTISGIGQNVGNAQSLLNELSGSLSSLQQAFNSPGGANPIFLPGEGKQRDWKQREFSFFFKDDYKVTPNLTLNLGLRYEFYAVPFDGNGKAAALVGGSAGVFGISGNNFGVLFQPGKTGGALSQLQLVGPGSPNPDKGLYRNDLNNFAPAVGMSWLLPYFGKNKTVLRMGYSMGYERNSLRIVDVLAGDLPGLRTVTTFTTGSYLDLSRARLPLIPQGKPLEVVPITQRTQTLRAFDTNLRMPYIQNWNISIQRELTKNTVLEVRYVGNKGTRLWRGTDINEVNIFETGILDAFKTTQAGGNSPLLDTIFMGLNIPGLGVVNGATITGSDVVRFNTTTQGHLAGNGAGSFAEFLNTSNQYTGEVGGLIRRAGFAENWIVANPQFVSSRLTGNFANSTYHSMQVEVIRRFTAGFQYQGNYTWSKALGEEEGSGQEQLDSYRNLRDRSLDKRILDFSVSHVWRNNGTWNLPFGPNRRFLNGGNRLVSRLVEQWTIGTIFNVFSGDPLTLSSGVASYNTFGDNTPMLVGSFPNDTGSVMVTETGPVYFNGLKQVADPSIANITTIRGIQGRSTLKAIADASGNLLLVNPTPGILGSLGHRYITGPGAFRLDVSLIKRFRLAETKTLEFRATATDLLNMPQWNNPNTDVNSTNFGRITGASGNRVIVVEGRINF